MLFHAEPPFAMFISGLGKTAIIDHGSDSYVNRSDSAFALITAVLQRFHALLLVVTDLVDQLGHRIAF